MLTSLMKSNPTPFNTTAFAQDFRSLNPAEQEKVASKLAARAKNAEIERDGMADMGISVGVDALAIAAAAFVTARYAAKRDWMVAEWLSGGAALAGKDTEEYKTPWFSGSDEKNPAGIMGIGLLPKSLFVPVIFFIGTLFEWQGDRYAREGGFAALLYILGDSLREVVYKKRLESLAKEALEEAAA